MRSCGSLPPGIFYHIPIFLCTLPYTCVHCTVPLGLRVGGGAGLYLRITIFDADEHHQDFALRSSVTKEHILRNALIWKEMLQSGGRGGFHWNHLKSYFLAKTRQNMKIKIYFKPGKRQARCVTLFHQSNHSSHMCFCSLSAHFVICKYCTNGSKIKESLFFHGAFRKNRANHMCHFFMNIE